MRNIENLCYTILPRLQVGVWNKANITLLTSMGEYTEQHVRFVNFAFPCYTLLYIPFVLIMHRVLKEIYSLTEIDIC